MEVRCFLKYLITFTRFELKFQWNGHNSLGMWNACIAGEFSITGDIKPHFWNQFNSYLSISQIRLAKCLLQDEGRPRCWLMNTEWHHNILIWTLDSKSDDRFQYLNKFATFNFLLSNHVNISYVGRYRAADGWKPKAIHFHIIVLSSPSLLVANHMNQCKKYYHSFNLLSFFRDNRSILILNENGERRSQIQSTAEKI